MKPIAIIGAGGFVGARLIERAELRGDIPLVPIVRSPRSQGRLARFGIRTVHGDASDPASLVPLLKGCGTVVNLTMGDDKRTVGDAQSIHAACQKADVPLFVHMSSAEVFGRAETHGLNDDSVPDGKHWMEYAQAKSAAEAWLRSQSAGPVQTVILRPGLIWGPGSGWLVEPAKALIDGTAYLLNGGRGICNLIHVDNLIEHLVQLAKSAAPRSDVFNIADNETLTWADYYRAIAHEVGVDPSTIRLLGDAKYDESNFQKIQQILNIAPARAIKRRLSAGTKGRLKQQLQDRISPPITEPQPIEPEPTVTKQLWWLQGTARKLPSTKFAEQYPELQLKPFDELMTAAGKWLRFAGFENSDRT
ncbi:NAD-dependent epimerase/dehydratase family protein [Mycolicibacterium aichiense]|uniref:NAD-dependent epimerase/dehydratase family protein n=1 Tax=Mycolicibacterium aichiense TaxID=1799 RepID=UPI000E00F5C5|nr:NAD(P)-dependent oxidoreductase [Mycolicibacterium aichiense]MCV7017334.1 NAD(P)-dependent oxidoreductase [Mycolicibacterium aichiense]STZ26105.1 dehydrogenase [Mycolicibacterium aichiense]